MRLLLECLPDETLARELGKTRRECRHSNDKGRICKELMRVNGEKLVGLIDEDPGAVQPRYLGELDLEEDAEQLGLRLLRDPKRGHRIVVVRPRLEEWVIRTASDARLKMADFGLSETGNALHKEINFRIPNFVKLIAEIRARGSKRLERLQAALHGK